MQFDRREFMKMMSAWLAMAAYDPEAFALEGETAAIHATHLGAFRAYMKNGRFVNLKTLQCDKEPPDFLQAMRQWVYADNRIKYPCVRKSYLNGSDNRHLRGCEEFVRVSWEQALDLAAAALDKTRREYGNEAIFRTTYATWSHPGKVHQPASLQGRMLGLLGGFSDTVGDYSAGAATQIMPYVTGELEVYSQQTTRDVISANTKLIIMWGTDPFKTEKIDNNIPTHTSNEWFRQMKKKGVKFISIDPTRNHTAQALGCEWVPIKASTDVAMILGMCYVLYEEKLYNKDFIDKYTVGFNSFLKYLLGREDGVKKDAEWAHKKCGVPADKIKQIARAAVSTRTILTASWACQRIQYGEQFHWSLVVLASMIGQIGLPGGGMALNMHYSGACSAFTGAGVPSSLSQGRNPVSTIIPASRLADTLLNPGKTIDYNGRKLTYPNVKLLYSAGVTPIGHHADVNKIVAGFRAVDAVITHEPWWTPTAKFSDIVLPTTTSFERNDISYGSTFGVEFIWAMKRLIKPMFEAKDDFEIFRELSKRFGFEKRFTGGKTPTEWLKWSYKKTRSSVDFNTFWNRGYVHYNAPEKNRMYVRYADFRANPQKNHLMTPSGRIEIFSEKIASFGYKDCVGHPVWLEPDEGGSVRSKKYPFQLMTPHPYSRLHSQLDNTEFSLKSKVNGREPVYMNPADAKKINVKNGDVVEVFNQRGTILAGVVITGNIVRGVAAVAEGAWYAPEDPKLKNSRCVSGQVNVLTSDRPSSRLSQGMSANTCAVGIRKAKGKLPRNTAYDPPRIRGEKN